MPGSRARLGRAATDYAYLDRNRLRKAGKVAANRRGEVDVAHSFARKWVSQRQMGE